MPNSNTIQIYEYDWLEVGQPYGEDKIVFEKDHYLLLAQYLTKSPNSLFYKVYLNKIRFSNYVGIIKIKNLNIEVLPKTDRHSASQGDWQKVLIEMLAISHKVRASTTTKAHISIRKYTVLEMYLQLFLEETGILLHEGLVKKYRNHIGNHTTLKGRLLIHQHVTKNLVHGERFYISHQVYDRNNIFNSILKQTLETILMISDSNGINHQSQNYLLDFPDCKAVIVSEKLFKNLIFDRKTERYKNAIELARIILMNYHPDLRGGSNNILAIMFDMNLLWETYIYRMLNQASIYFKSCMIESQQSMNFWDHSKNWGLTIRPDLVVKFNDETYILDTKWKYQKDTTTEDVRQMYTYGKYWKSSKRYLIYPDQVTEQVNIEDGSYYDEATEKISLSEKCDLMYVDPLNVDNSLNKDIGHIILAKLLV